MLIIVFDSSVRVFILQISQPRIDFHKATCKSIGTVATEGCGALQIVGGWLLLKGQVDNANYC